MSEENKVKPRTRLINALELNQENKEKVKKLTHEDEYYEMIYDNSIKLAEFAEKITLLTRELPYLTKRAKAGKDVRKILKETMPIEMGFTDRGWFSVRIPALLPKKSQGNGEYISTPLWWALERFFKDKLHLHYKDCVLIFRHVYDYKRPERQYRDHNNIEINKVIDVLGIYVKIHGGPTALDHYYCSAAGPENKTEIYVVPQNEIIEWWKMMRNIPVEGLKLSEENPNQDKKDM